MTNITGYTNAVHTFRDKYSQVLTCLNGHVLPFRANTFFLHNVNRGHRGIIYCLITGYMFLILAILQILASAVDLLCLARWRERGGAAGCDQ